jgi:glycosyltransferase involved in cell wall biosynthesis
MENCPTVSIVTPSFNQGRFIEETIKSVLSQSGDFFLDYIIIDGCSTDNSLEIIRKYDCLLKEGKFPVACRAITYRWLSEPDNGQADAINKGFRLAKGEIIAYLNSDDTYNPGAIAKAVDCFLRNPGIGLVYGDNNQINEDGNFVNCEKARGEFNFSTLKKRNVLVQPAVFIKQEALDKAGYLDPALHFVLDYEWFIRISRRYKGKYMPFALANFRAHPQAKTFDDYSLGYMAEYLAVIRKYGGRRNFSRAFSEKVIQLTKNRMMAIQGASASLKEAVLKVNSDGGFGVSQRDFSMAYAYISLWNAFNCPTRDRRAALDDFKIVLFKAPVLLFSVRGLHLLFRLALPIAFFQ